jgi:hypothetical protein
VLWLVAMTAGKRLAAALLALIVAAALWLPALHLVFAEDPAHYSGSEGVPPKAQKLAARHVSLWTDAALRAEEIRRMRTSNAEWDFMGRTFLALSLAEMGLRDPAAKERHLAVIDAILDETLRLEREEGLYHFLMPYARARPFVQQPARSQFLDGEIALMLGARRMLSEDPARKATFTDRVALIAARMRGNPVLSTESYPDECWTFCNALALASLRMAEVLDGADHSALLGGWVQAAKAKLVDPRTGLLVSSYTLAGEHKDGPEGSSIWLVAHALRAVDDDFARDQFERARRELRVSVLGFGYAREWPRSWTGGNDVDSGPVIPLLDVSAGSSGLAFLGAASFGDRAFLAELHTTVDFAGFPAERGGALQYQASNQVGDAVLLYSTVVGPMWDALARRTPR